MPTSSAISDGRRLGVDPLDQRGAGRRVEEVADNEQLELARRHTLHTRRRGELFGRTEVTAARRRQIRMSCCVITARTTLFINVIRTGSGTEVSLIITATA